MNTVIVYDSQFGNTEQIARAIAERLGSARLMRVEELGALAHPACDLLIVVLSQDMSYRANFCPRLRKSYRGSAISCGSDAQAGAISGSSWKRYDWRLYATAWTDDHLSRAIGHHPAVQPLDSPTSRLQRRTPGSIWMVRKPQSYTAQEGDSAMCLS